MSLPESTRWDAVVVGSGFGGAMVAHRLIEAGARVLMIERGDWVERGDAAWRPEASLELTPHYAKDIPYRCERGAYDKTIGGYACVGGPSVFYGCVSFRFREQDFVGDPDVVADSGAAWPYRYDELEPHYAEAERLLGVSGDDAGDPTAPPRSGPYPQPPAPLAKISERISDAAGGLGLHPFRLPLAINYAEQGGRQACIGCRTCDTFACAIEAKNDVATRMIKPLMARGMALWTRTVATRLETDDAGRRITALHVVRRDGGEAVRVEADVFVVAAGALGTPHLLLASKLDEASPARAAVGRYLMRHDNAMVFGFYWSKPDQENRFHKQIAINDWYFGDPDGKDVAGLTKLGGVQQVMTPPKDLVKAHLPRGTKAMLGAFTQQLTGLLCIAEDQPRAANGVGVDWDVKDAYGLPQLVIDTGYSDRDARALRGLTRRAKRVLRRSGAWFFHTHAIKTFSHAVGTVRMGVDPATSPLDDGCRFRGVDNLWVTDGAALPMSAGVNPSLTIAANALRAADGIVAAQRGGA
ncbi:MAG: GMC family oxidoreductase [Kofleriaceae bacterium]|nr:GMC family oxidoreductase [Myxococcales bacterium]MCB9560519.1 GMC family oxidoreductase [Kofleriaceae bacterium]